MASKREQAKKIIEDLLAGRKLKIPPSLQKQIDKMMKAAEAGQTTPKGAPRRTRNLGISSDARVPSSQSLVNIPKPPIKGGGFTGGPKIVGGPIVPYTGGPSKIPPFKPGLLEKVGGAIRGHKLAAGLGGLGGLLLAMGIKGQVKSRMERARQAKAIKGLPPATVEAVMQARRQKQMLATKRAMLMRNDPEAFQLLMMGLSGEQPQALARGEVLLGRQPQIAPQAAQNVESLLAAMG